MLTDSGVEMLPPAQVLEVQKKNPGAVLQSVRVERGATYSAKIFVDASYEGDLMSRAGVAYTVGRESRATYNESDAGSRGTAVESAPVP